MTISAEAASTETPPLDRLLVDVEGASAIATLGVRTIWRMESAGDFPACVRIPNSRAKRWRVGDIVAWAEGLSQ